MCFSLRNTDQKNGNYILTNQKHLQQELNIPNCDTTSQSCEQRPYCAKIWKDRMERLEITDRFCNTNHKIDVMVVCLTEIEGDLQEMATTCDVIRERASLKM